MMIIFIIFFDYLIMTIVATRLISMMTIMLTRSR